MAQHYNTKKAKELFGDRSDAAVMKELNQINDFETYVPIKASDVSWEEKNKALESLIFVTDRKNGNLKARKVADGSKQRKYDGHDKSDGSPPTVHSHGEHIYDRGRGCKREKRCGCTRHSKRLLAS